MPRKTPPLGSSPCWPRRARLQERPCTSALEDLLPLVAHGALGAEDPATLTQRHLGQLVGLGQAALDYLIALVAQTGAALVSVTWLGGAVKRCPLPHARGRVACTWVCGVS